MGIRGKQSVASLSVASLGTRAGRVRAPEDLPEPCKAIWRELVETMPPGRFHRSDVPLLALYCRALHQSALAFAKLEQFGAADGNLISPWLKVADTSAKQCATLASKLRLCPHARLDQKVAGPMARVDRSGPAPWPPESELAEEDK